MSNKVDLQKELIKYTLSMYNHTNIPRNTIDELISNTETFISQVFIPHLQEKLATELQGYEKNIVYEKVQLALKENKDPLFHFSTEHRRFQMYARYSGFVEPEMYKIGDNVEFEPTDDSASKAKLEPAYGAYMPMKNTLTNILNIPGLLNEIFKYIDKLNKDDTVSNVMQGRMWKRKYINSERDLILPIFLYYDDFEPGNALGSHAGTQGLGGVYFSLPFLPPHIVAKLNNIFLAAIFYSKDRKKFGNTAVFEKVIEGINTLSTEGISVDTTDSTITIKFRCVLVLGDNLGVNATCGFSESFVATRFCRICTATSLDCKMMTEEDETLLRNRENYEADLNSNDSTTGIKEECVFNKIIDFHVTENKSVDMMHDLFEGVVNYTLSKILTCLIITEKLFTLDALNSRIKNFDFGNQDDVNKPQPITKEVSRKKEGDKVQNKIKLIGQSN